MSKNIEKTRMSCSFWVTRKWQLKCFSYVYRKRQIQWNLGKVIHKNIYYLLLKIFLQSPVARRRWTFDTWVLWEVFLCHASTSPILLLPGWITVLWLRGWCVISTSGLSRMLSFHRRGELGGDHLIWYNNVRCPFRGSLQVIIIKFMGSYSYVGLHYICLILLIYNSSAEHKWSCKTRVVIIVNWGS